MQATQIIKVLTDLRARATAAHERMGVANSEYLKGYSTAIRHAIELIETYQSAEDAKPALDQEAKTL